ncbi:CDP-diacylglycerol--glycerol-3-phosphate 3-phosphatidyltransferase [Corynebacterium lowii]|nr:CDP-diacylglycerol--glycerol-3-phosphate 3-phosphatidyltransferase [Corynebacterium lowii]
MSASTASGGSPAQAPSNWNLPNFLTCLRIVFVPVFVWLVLRADNTHTGWMWAAFGVFAALMLTDKLDGDIARSRGLVTDFGKIADPIADKALMISALVCLNITGAMPVWITVVIVVRELGITLWRMVLLRRGKVVPASRGGKIKTVLQSLGVALYLCPLPEWMTWPTHLVMGAAVAVTVVTGVQYILDAQRQPATLEPPAEPSASADRSAR